VQGLRIFGLMGLDIRVGLQPYKIRVKFWAFGYGLYQPKPDPVKKNWVIKWADPKAQVAHPKFSIK
jgi:hypothetical protein